MDYELIAHGTMGTGEPVVLLNGGMMSMAAWDPIAGPLSAEYQVVRCDLRGQLLSPGVAPPSIEAHVDDVVRVLDRLQIERVHIVGVSFGGFVGMLLAARHPERARSLVVVTSTAEITDADWTAGQPVVDACDAAAAGTGDRGRVLELLTPNTFSDRYLAENAALVAARRNLVGLLPTSYFAGIAGILAALKGMNLKPWLGQIRCATLVVGGASDRMFPVERSREIAGLIPGAVLVVLPDAAHGAVIEDPGRVLEVLRGFLHEAGAAHAAFEA
jgi:pimeloyl-ACP methyl ester carboxylesterase